MSDWSSLCLQSLPSPTVSASRSLSILLVADSRLAADRVLAELRTADAALTRQLALTLPEYQACLAAQTWDIVLVCQLLHADADPLALPLRALDALRCFHLPPPAILWTSPLGDRAAITCLQAGFTDCVLSTHSAKLVTALWQAVSSADRQRQEWQQFQLGRLVAAMQAAGEDDAASLSALVEGLPQSVRASGCLLLQSNADRAVAVRHFATRDSNHSPAGQDWLFPLVQSGQPQLAAGSVLHWSDCDRVTELSRLAADALQRASIRAFVLAPICWQQTDLGTLAVYDRRGGRTWQPAELALIEAVAQQAARVLQQAHLAQQVQDRQQQVATAQQLAQLEQENRIKSELLSTMSHELRAPLTGILGFARMLHEQIYGALNAKQVQYVSAIASSGKYLLALIEDLLDLSRIEAQREAIYPDTIVVEEVCLSALGIVQSQAELKGIDLRFDLAPEATTCEADQQRLKQILINLLSNAIKFTETGSVTLAVRQANRQLQFTVADTGIGIDPADYDRLFLPFCQIHNRLQREHKGTGLGLALSRQLARLHGGDIAVESKPGQGSRFTVSLPLTPPEPADRNVSPAQP